MNENEKLAEVEEQSDSALIETEAQTSNDSQQNTDSQNEALPVDVAAKDKSAPRKRSSATKKTSEDTSFPADTEEKPKAKRGSGKKAKKHTPDERFSENSGTDDNKELSNASHITEEAVANEQPVSSDTDSECNGESETDSDYEPREIKVSEDEDVLENQLSIPFFSISSDYFDLNYKKSVAEDYGDEYEDDDTSTDEAEKIIPPDELFAYRSYTQSENEVTEDYSYENDLEEVTVEEYSDENIDNDGQYTLAELELQSDSAEKPFTEEAMPKYDPKKPRRIDGRFDLVELFVFTLLAVMIITTFFFRHSIVDGSSMANTLHTGEHLIISDLFYTPKRGDIIVCEDYTTDIQKPIVKRVIGVAGDVITITKEGEVFVNGILLVEDYVYLDGPYKQNYGNFEVLEGELFVMGDNRNNSYDSRAEDVGTISVDSVLGKVLFRFYPFNKFGTVD